MGALALDHETRTGRRQPRLFAVPDGAVAVPVAPESAPAALAAVAPTPLAGVAPAARLRPAPVAAPVRTLDTVVGDLFATVASGRQATCLFCGGAVRPRPTAAGAAGAGRCDDCGTGFE